MANFKLKRGAHSKITTEPFQDGTIFFSPETGRIYIDYGQENQNGDRSVYLGNSTSEPAIDGNKPNRICINQKLPNYTNDINDTDILDCGGISASVDNSTIVIDCGGAEGNAAASTPVYNYGNLKNMSQDSNGYYITVLTITGQNIRRFANSVDYKHGDIVESEYTSQDIYDDLYPEGASTTPYFGAFVYYETNDSGVISTLQIAPVPILQSEE